MGVIHLQNISKWARWEPIDLSLVAQISYLSLNPKYFLYVWITSQFMYSIYTLYTTRSSLSLKGTFFHQLSSISILDSYHCPLRIITSDHSQLMYNQHLPFVHCSTLLVFGFTFLSQSVKDCMKSKCHFDLSFQIIK